MAGNPVIYLPGDELRMLAERFGHRRDDAPAVIPINVAVHAVGAARALVAFEAAVIDGKDFGMTFRQPERWGGGGCAEDNFNSSFAHDVHGAPEPFKVVLALLAFTNAPGELAHANQ